VTCSDIGRCDDMGVSNDNRRRVRIQVMKDFRYKERLRNSTSKSHFHDEMSLGSRLSEISCKVSERGLASVATLPLQIPTIYTSELWRSSFARSMAEG
jgi:hypothetical protein